MPKKLVTFNILLKHLKIKSKFSEIYPSHFHPLPVSSYNYVSTHGVINAGKESTLDLKKPESETKLNIYTKTTEDWGEIISKWYKKYQDFVGISEILLAQERVTQITNQLIEVQSQRRQLQREVETVNQQLLVTHQQITKSELYSEDHYKLFENARILSSNLKNLQDNFTKKEEEERDLFTHLSSAIKFCHEKERTQSENAKYWSILLSLVSAAIASFITSVNNWVRIKEIKEHASSLHKEAIIKSEELIDRIPRLSTSTSEANDDHQISLTLKQIVPKLQEVIRNEFKKINIGTSNLVIEPKVKETAQEVSYVKIMSFMAVGAAVGTLITAIFLGNFTGGS